MADNVTLNGASGTFDAATDKIYVGLDNNVFVLAGATNATTSVGTNATNAMAVNTTTHQIYGPGTQESAYGGNIGGPCPPIPALGQYASGCLG